MQARPRILSYLQQDAGASCKLEDAKKQLFELTAWIDQLEKVIKTQAAAKAARPAAKAPQT